MNTLYDVLGIDRLANATQIEQGYRSMTELLAKNGDDQNFERDMIRAKAIKEAYTILSSPQRRAVYDEKLKSREQVSYAVAETSNVPWVTIGAIVLLLGAVFGYYQYRTQQAAALELAALQAAKARTEAETAARLAEAETVKLEQQVLDERKRADMIRQRESEAARRDGHQIHYELLRAEAQEEREQQRAAREKEHAVRQAKAEREQEEQAALRRSREQAMAMQRALAIPIVRH